MGKPKLEKENTGPTLISIQEMQEREKKYMQRLQDISVSCNYIRESTMEFARLEEQRARLEHWEHYLRCDGLPRPYLPPEMRTFLAKKRHYQHFNTVHNVDWTLSIDERTVLNQNIFRTDLTRRTLKENLTENIGDLYEADIFMYVSTLVKIDCMLGNAAEMERVDFGRQMEIMDVRREIEHEIDDVFDRLTYRIIRMDGVYMNSDNALVATWSHACPNYTIDLWALRDVPVRFEQMLAPLMVAEMSASGVSVQMPLSVLHDCLTLRCIHTKFDNYSQYAKSFDPCLPDGNVDVNAGIVDIEECLANEWYMQLDIQTEMLLSLLEKREAYDEALRIIAEKTEKSNKEKKNNEGNGTKIVIPKAPKEALQVPPSMLPDAYSTFLEREQQQYMDMLDEIYNPANLKLALDEINLRQYIMMGGLYSLMFIRRPMNTHYQKLNIILHEDGRVLHIMDDIVANLHRDDDSRPGSRTSRLSERRSKLRLNMDDNQRRTFMLEDDELPYFFVIIHMPRELCLWGEPIACQYLCTIEEQVSEVSLTDDRKESVIKKKKSKISSARHTELNWNESLQFTQIPRRETSINVFRPTLISLLRVSRKLMPGENVLPLRNFHLVQQLDHLKVRQLERYCVPRIISSFKFPLEVREELEQRPKTRNMLIRRRSVEVEDNFVVGDLDFDYEVQQAAERVYPVFHDIEHVKYDEEDIQQPFEKKSIYGLIDTFESISHRYIARHRDITNQSDFIMKKLPSKKTVVPSPDRQTVLPKFKSSIRVGSRHSSLRGSHSPLPTSGSQMSGYRNSSRLNLNDGATDTQDTRTPEAPTPLEEEVNAEKPKVKVIRWSTRHIMSSQFDRQARTMHIKTDRLGIFGLAYKRYEHFPFRDWSMQPNEENNEEIILSVDTFHARVILYITAQGIRGYVTDITKNYVAHPVKYLDIPNPISDIRELRRRFYEKSINIFAENDACFYIDNGYFSVKHVATEDHTYDAMALHCKLMKFYRSSWNRLASRRNILMGMKNAKDNSDYTEVTMRITPDSVSFVEVSELCSDNLDVIRLDFKNTWRNMSNYTDLHQAISSMNPHATDVRNKDPLLLFQVKRMLNELHIMSFS
ncbi:uncharacterized protein [Drosophila virilis]|uniref:Uncharacterized protein, isoform A n=1 Tax=Drosophila virilis TaxID=7244 RepID=B4LB74_DROVI|nr:uncharacterized protein LOC6624025 [Drosophila virilis]EDW68638.1 uncharacterized protein Dvir_GJ12585, isoform A [Drosophila virilis]